MTRSRLSHQRAWDRYGGVPDHTTERSDWSARRVPSRTRDEKGWNRRDPVRCGTEAAMGDAMTDRTAVAARVRDFPRVPADRPELKQSAVAVCVTVVDGAP